MTAWLNGSTVEKIAEALKTTANAVNQRVYVYRREYNLPLPKRPWSDTPGRRGPPKKIDVAALTALIASHAANTTDVGSGSAAA